MRVATLSCGSSAMEDVDKSPASSQLALWDLKMAVLRKRKRRRAEREGNMINCDITRGQTNGATRGDDTQLNLDTQPNLEPIVLEPHADEN